MPDLSRNDLVASSQDIKLPPIKPHEFAESHRALSHELFSSPQDFLKVMKNNFDRVDTDHNGLLSRKEVEHAAISSYDQRLAMAATMTTRHGDAIQGLAEEMQGHPDLKDWNMAESKGISRQDLDQGIRIEDNTLIVDKLRRAILPELEFVGSIAGVTAGSFLTAASLPSVGPSAGFAAITGLSMATATASAIETGNKWSEVDKVANDFRAELRQGR